MPDEVKVPTYDAGDVIEVDGQKYYVLFPTLTRSLSTTEYVGLKTDIEANGIRVAIVLDDKNNIIDGIHRLSIAKELKRSTKDIPLDRRQGLTPETAAQLAKALNVHRRHLRLSELKELRQERIEKITEMYKQGMSKRQIARETNVSTSQVDRDLRGGNTGQKYPTTSVVGEKRPVLKKRLDVDEKVVLDKGKELLGFLDSLERQARMLKDRLGSFKDIVARMDAADSLRVDQTFARIVDLIGELGG